MSALADQHQAAMGARARLGFPMPMPARVKRPAAPIVVVAPEVVALKPHPVAELPTRRKQWGRIIEEVALKHSVSSALIMSSNRSRRTVAARNEAIWRIRHEIIVLGEPMSLTQIGKRLGKDHTSILHSLRTYAKGLGIDYAFHAIHRKKAQFGAIALPPEIHSEHMEDRPISGEAV